MVIAMLASLSLVANPIRGADDVEFLVDTNITSIPALGSQNLPAAAFDGENFLVVWQDCRHGADADIHGARVSPLGVLLDSTGIAISTAEGTQDCPTVAFDGMNFPVAWSDGRAGAARDIYGARVSSRGVVLDPGGIPISVADD